MADKRISARRAIGWAVVLLAVPGTIWLGWRYAARQYYAASLLVILWSMLPFFLLFEKRRPQARELVVIAVMSALAAASRAAFVWAPSFKPITGIVIITGVALGAEAGFLTGALAAFVSNFLFGQGTWTPWQMFAFGLAGFLAGALHARGWLSGRKLPLSLFGAAAVLLLIGPLLDTCALFTMAGEVTRGTAAAIYLSGLPVNAVHALATALTIWLLSGPLLDKLGRIRLKYGLMEGGDAL